MKINEGMSRQTLECGTNFEKRYYNGFVAQKHQIRADLSF
jgi:hypothetical protein